MVTVVCLKTGDKYWDEYVLKMERMVFRNLPELCRFVCFTDQSVKGIECLPPPCDLPSWWGKIGFFRPDLPIEGAFLYLDLDMVIVDNISDLINTDKDFRIIKHWKKKLKRKDTILRYNSSCMFFAYPGVRPLVYDNFTSQVPSRVKDDPKGLRGDQDWIAKCYYNEATFPEGWFTAAEDYRGDRIRTTKVVVCNKWDQHKIRGTEWIKQHWR